MSWAEQLKTKNAIYDALVAYNFSADNGISLGEDKVEINSPFERLFVPRGVTEILGRSSPLEGVSVEEVIIPSTTRIIHGDAFLYLSRLKSVLFCNGVEEIQDGAFNGNTRLYKISLPPSVSYIGDSAFSDCTNLRWIYVPFGEGEVAGAPWGATNATVYYNSKNTYLDL